MQKVISQKQLDRLIEKSEFKVSEYKILECFVMLDGGVRSSKAITLKENNSYFIINEVDNTRETIPHDKLMDSFPIGEAIKKGVLYSY